MKKNFVLTYAGTGREECAAMLHVNLGEPLPKEFVKRNDQKLKLEVIARRSSLPGDIDGVIGYWKRS